MHICMQSLGFLGPGEERTGRFPLLPSQRKAASAAFKELPGMEAPLRIVQVVPAMAQRNGGDTALGPCTNRGPGEHGEEAQWPTTWRKVG